MNRLFRWSGAFALLIGLAVSMSWPAGVTDLLDLCTGKNNSNCPFKVDANGNVTAGGTVTTTGITSTGNSTFGGLLSPTVQKVTISNNAAQITPTSPYIVLQPSLLAISSGTVLISIPTISTSIAPNGAAYPDGTYLTITSSNTTQPIVLQDSATLSGTQLYTKNSMLGSPGTPVLTSTVTLQFQFNAAANGWNLVP